MIGDFEAQGKLFIGNARERRALAGVSGRRAKKNATPSGMAPASSAFTCRCGSFRVRGR
jgi:hypothetical protein